MVSLRSTQSMLHIPCFKVTPRHQFSLTESCCGLTFSFTQQYGILKITPRTPFPPLSISRLFRFPLWIHMVMRQTPDLPQSSQHHIHGKRILSRLGGHLALSSWSESVQGWLTTIRQGLHTTAPATLKSIPGDTETTRPDCSQMLCFPGPSAMKIYLCNYTAAWGAGNPQGK